MNPRVLLVDDEEGIREALAAYLAMRGCVVLPAATCAQARASFERADLLVTDEGLPDGRGHRLAREWLAGAPTRRTLIYTARPEQLAATWVAEDPRIEVATKPVAPALLLAFVEKHADADEDGRRPAQGGFAEALREFGTIERSDDDVVVLRSDHDPGALIDRLRRNGHDAWPLDRAGRFAVRETGTLDEERRMLWEADPR